MIPLPPSIFKLLISCLFAVAMACIVGDYCLAYGGKVAPSNLSGLAHVAVGGLIGLLVYPTSGEASGTQKQTATVTVAEVTTSGNDQTKQP